MFFEEKKNLIPYTIKIEVCTDLLLKQFFFNSSFFKAKDKQFLKCIFFLYDFLITKTTKKFYFLNLMLYYNFEITGLKF